jgi:hypothetical protein
MKCRNIPLSYRNVKKPWPTVVKHCKTSNLSGLDGEKALRKVAERRMKMARCFSGGFIIPKINQAPEGRQMRKQDSAVPPGLDMI